MDKSKMFIELLKMEHRKSKALAEMTEGSVTNANFTKEQKVRAASFLECVEWAELLLLDGKANDSTTAP